LALELKVRIEARTARVAIVGLGYVGLPLAETFAWGGYPVIGFDIDEKKIEKLRRGESYIGHIASQRVAELLASGRFEASCDPRCFTSADCIVICVPTPLGEAREPDLSYIVSTGETLTPHLRRGQLVVLESTTYPGTTEEVLLPLLERFGRKAGEDFFLAYSPEREDPGNRDFATRNIPKVVGGLDRASQELAVALYTPVVEGVVGVSSMRVAEATKILENTYRAVNIAMVNELKSVFAAMGIDIWEVIAAAKTKPFGFQAFYPGPGLGGHCLAGSETVRVRGRRTFDTVLPLADLFDRCGENICHLGDVSVIEPDNLETLSIDLKTGETGWKKVSHLFRRTYSGEMVEVRLAGNHVLRTTDRHPMLIVENDRLVMRDARDLQPGDRVPLFNGVTAGQVQESDPTLDLLETRPDPLIDKLHVRIQGIPWSRHESLLKQRYGWTIRDSIRLDSLSARRFLEVESEVGANRQQVIEGEADARILAVLRDTTLAQEVAEQAADVLRGDGDVDVHTGIRSYQKHGRHYQHEFNAGQVGYFSSSPELLAQAETLLQGLSLQPSRKKGKPHLRFTGSNNLDRQAGLITGAKGTRLAQLADSRLRRGASRNVRPWAGGISLPVASVRPSPKEEFVYSMEVPGWHTFATTGGVFVHNCIPIDPFYLTWAARRYGLNTRFIELAGEINTAMPQYVVDRVADALNDEGKAVRGSSICVLGVAYKKDVDDARESPAFTILELLQARGARICYNDPHVPTLPPMRHHKIRLDSQPLTAEFLAKQDCVLIVTNHSKYDYAFLVEHARLVVDTRNATAGQAGGRARIVKA
jgi:UDP-N-acetyl-D-mannosaminuronate dehydrogenase